MHTLNATRGQEVKLPPPDNHTNLVGIVHPVEFIYREVVHYINNFKYLNNVILKISDFGSGKVLKKKITVLTNDPANPKIFLI